MTIYVLLYRNPVAALRGICIDAETVCGVNRLTDVLRVSPGVNSARKVRQQAFKDRRPHRRGNPQSSATQGSGPQVPRQRVLRPPGCRASQIRDAATRLHRQGDGDGGLRGIWCLKANLLSGQGKLRCGWYRRADARKAWPAWPPQARRSRADIPSGTARAGRTGTGPRAGKTDPPRSPYRTSSENDRAGVKKNPQVNTTAISVASSSVIATQYEVLRGAALGEVLPLMARSGLMLFLRRGMWGWAKALTAIESSPRKQDCPSSVTATAQGGHSAVVHVLASIAMNIHDRRSP